MNENIVGKKPRKPQTYEMRKKRGEEKDILFCNEFDEKLKKWDDQCEKLRLKTIESRKNDPEIIVNDFLSKKINVNYKSVYHDFLQSYLFLNKVRFNEKNIFSNTDEPKQYIYTLIFYFLKDERFFKSPLLRKDLSEPSFDKGTLSIGGCGSGKTSIFESLIYAFSMFIKEQKKSIPENLNELIDQFEINKCNSNQIVKSHEEYRRNGGKNPLNELYERKQLYIDDLMSETDSNHFGTKNIFLDVLTHRADRNKKTHLSMNLMREKDKSGNSNEVSFLTLERSIYEMNFRYDYRVYDRVFGNYNIIELKGKSARR